MTEKVLRRARQSDEKLKRRRQILAAAEALFVEGDKRMKTSIGFYYQDEYVRENNRWLIAKRRSVFDWEDKRESGE